MSVDWARTYTEVYPDLFRFLYSKVWDEDRAHDLAQEAFVRGLSHEPDDPRAWLFSVAANLARDEARTAIRRRRHLALLKSEARVAPAAEPEAPKRLERQERERVARHALEALGERDRDILLLWNAGHDYQEIARQTGLAPGAIGTTLARARRRLVEAHEAMEGEDVARN